MAFCPVLLLLLLAARGGLFQQQQGCSKSEVNTCSDCIRSGAHCVWCKQLNFTDAGKDEATRCDTRENLQESGCDPQEIVSPVNSHTVVKQEPLSNSFTNQEPVQLRPQVVSLNLRPGSPETFTVSFKRVQGYPVDLYYLMDLSNSMKDDLDNVKSLGGDLLKALNSITQHAQIGFGAFVDKTVLPYTNTNEKKLQRPCDDDTQQCQAVFGYRHVLSMTSDRNEFNRKVTEQFISGNLDSPEGGLDAMMQAAVCEDIIGWRNSSTRLIVLTTDAGFHMAGDGKLAGILEPNDQQCHLSSNLYTKSNYMDYPSVGQLAMQLEKRNIQPIFAVTKNVESVYQQLSQMIPKSEVGVLSDDSGNVVQLIKSAYNRLSSKVTLTHESLPSNVKVVYTPRCTHAGPANQNEGVCDNVREGEEISFDVSVTVDSCMEDTSFTIRPLGIRDTLTVTLATKCECQCGDLDQLNHTHCNRHGQVQCGVCSCHDGFVGQFCNCSVGERDERSLRDQCRRESSATECEGRGDCVCGRCECHHLEGGRRYYGKYCECDDDHCEKFNNKFCGGHGQCRCGQCQCHEGYEGSACQCKVSQDGCFPINGTVCYGRGRCQCNRCKCLEGYQEPQCKTCPGCPERCLSKFACVECRAFDSGPFSKNCSTACSSVTVEMVDRFTTSTKLCQQKDSEDCWVKFQLEQLLGEDNYRAQVLKDKDCPQPPSIVAIIGGSIASVALIGLLFLILLKLIFYMKDLKQWREFEKEKKKSVWTKANNPLFLNATTTVTNPTFTGE